MPEEKTLYEERNLSHSYAGQSTGIRRAGSVF